MRLKQSIDSAIKDAFVKAGIDAEPIAVSEAAKPEFGDFQFNGAMALAKRLKRAPREIAQVIAENVDSPVIKECKVAGAGFVNIWLDDDFLSSSLKDLYQTDEAVPQKRDNANRVVVDYSGPNMAKQMHVGHLRSSIIGDSLANIFEYLGDEVIRQNHIGDWGTQFGMLVAYLELESKDAKSSLSDLEQFYKDAKKRFDEDEKFADMAREYVVKIQSGEKRCVSLWSEFIEASLKHCEEVYEKLGVKLTRGDIRAESFYNDMLPKVIKRLEESGAVEVSDGAKCIFLDGHNAPFIVQKSDGGYLYATTDLAALWYRVDVLKADRICYVVDARQSQHFKQLFETAKIAGIVDGSVKLEHIAFGTMMDKGGKPFKTREGTAVKLLDLLDEAVNRARAAVKKSEEYGAEELENIARVIGIGAVKYADLSINREVNYLFDWEKMLSFEGNTALYMQYAYARIKSILRRYGDTLDPEILISDELEHKLAVKLLMLQSTIEDAGKKAMPSLLTSYLYELVTLFMRFYERNPILKEGIDEQIKRSRLTIASLCAKNIKLTLSLLGIDTVERL